MPKCSIKSSDVIIAKRDSNLHLGLWVSYNLEHFMRDVILGLHGLYALVVPRN